jgi:hypothetical protein
LICSFLDVSLRHPLCQKLSKILSGTTSVLLDSKDDTLMMLWRTQEFDHFPGRKRSKKFICSFLNVSLRYSVCQKPPRLLSGTPSILIDS